MRMQVRLPQIQAKVYQEPERCPYCGGAYFKEHGQKGQQKMVRDIRYEEVECQRKKCQKCKRTFRVYPEGITGKDQSQRLQAMSVLLYVLGLSYGGVSDFLGALGVYIGKTTVYENVQAAGVASRARQQQERGQGKCKVVGTDGTYIKIKGIQVGIQVVVDDGKADLLGLELMVSENSPEVATFIEAIAQEVGAEVLVSDDLGVYQEIADDLGLDHQICRKHVKDNVDEIVNDLFSQIKPDESVPPGVDSSPDLFSSDLALIQWLIWVRPKTAPYHLKRLYHRYKAASPAKPGRKHPIWYRMRTLITRLWNRWQRLTLDQRRGDLDGTNNASERVIGWWAKERYRTMRGYKREESVYNVVTLTARMGARSGAYDMAELYA